MKSATCPHCNQVVSGVSPGEPIRCPHCAGLFKIPVPPDIIDHPPDTTVFREVIPEVAELRPETTKSFWHDINWPSLPWLQVVNLALTVGIVLYLAYLEYRIQAVARILREFGEAFTK